MFYAIPPNFTRHFEHTEPFLDWWADYCGTTPVLEVGAGCCDFTKAMISRSIKVAAIEPRANDDVLRECSNFLLPQSIQKCALIRQVKAIVVVARPDHSGWVSSLPRLMHKDSEFIYIGLDRNTEIDLTDNWVWEELFAPAGADGEKVLKVTSPDNDDMEWDEWDKGFDDFEDDENFDDDDEGPC